MGGQERVESEGAAAPSTHPSTPPPHASVALEYLERYCVLILFTAYLGGPGSDVEAPGHESFAAWMRARPELRSVLTRMLRRNPLAALELHHPDRAAVGRHPCASDDDDDDDEAALLLAARRGAVLGAHTILKEDHYPGCQAPGLPAVLGGAPNFRGVPGARVYGGGAPTAAGVGAVLAAVCAAPGTSPMSQGGAGGGAAGGGVLWINLREEVCLYINGTPFVLREAERPYKNMREYVGISARRLEAMEARLRADVLAEAASRGGRVLVARETTAGPGGASVIDTWEAVTGKQGTRGARGLAWARAWEWAGAWAPAWARATAVWWACGPRSAALGQVAGGGQRVRRAGAGACHWRHCSPRRRPARPPTRGGM